MIKEFIQTVIKADNAYQGEGMMLALFFVMFIFIIFYSKDKKISQSIVIPIIVSIGILYIAVPFISVFIWPLEFFDGRLFWLLMAPFVTAVGFTLFVDGIKDNWKQWVAILVLIPIIFYCGKFAISNDMYKKAENQYRLPQSTVDIIDYVLNDENRVVEMDESEYREMYGEIDKPLLIVPYTISHPFRQLSTKVRLFYGEDATSGRIFATSESRQYVCEEMEHVIPNLDAIVETMDLWRINYILFDTVYTELCEDGNINIYGYEPDKRYVGDRTPTVDYSDLRPISVVDDEDPHWDLSAYDLTYCGRFGQYVLYRYANK